MLRRFTARCSAGFPPPPREPPLPPAAPNAPHTPDAARARLVVERGVWAGVVLRLLSRHLEKRDSAVGATARGAGNRVGTPALRDGAGAVSGVCGALGAAGGSGGSRGGGGKPAEHLAVKRRSIRAPRKAGPGGPARARAPALPSYASSSSIFLAAGSSLTMRKLRIWLARAGSLRGLELWPPFHLDCSMEVSEERSTFPSAGFSSGSAAAALRRQVA